MVQSRHAPRVHLVTPAIVERTVARRGVSRVLTTAERAMLDGLRLERRRRDWLAGRVAAKRVIRAHFRALGQPVPEYAGIEIWNEAGGAPRCAIDGRPTMSESLSLSIAHAEGAAVAGLSETASSGSVGVDVEVTKPLSLALVRRVLTPTELARVDGAPNAHPTPLALWTAKEAAMKAAHHICNGLRDVELLWTGRGTLRARVTAGHAPAHTIVVRHTAAGPYTIAVALYR